MSVYPKRLRQGETLYVHVRVRSVIPRRPLIRVHLEDPTGARTEIGHFHPWIFPAADDTAIEPASLPGSLQRVSPVYLLARHLTGPDGDAGSMLAMLEKTRSSTHFHLHHTLADDAPLGRYQVHIEMRSNGRVWGSDTASDAYFHVESVQRMEQPPGAVGGRALLLNPGPVVVPACVVSIDDDTLWRRGTELNPGPNVVNFRGARGYILYSDERHVLALHPTEELFCMRNEALAWRDDPDQDSVWIHGESSDVQGWALSGPSRRIWKAANGMTGRSLLRTPAQSREYDAMLAEGLLLEIAEG